MDINSKEQEGKTPNVPAKKEPVFKEVVTEEVAEQEVSRWLDRKKVYPHKREKYKDQVKNIVEAVRYGNLAIDEGGVLRQKLLFPLQDEEKNEVISELKYEPRARTEAINKALKGIDSEDGDGRTLGYIVALTNKSKTVLGLMDPVDTGLGRDIALFFM